MRHLKQVAILPGTVLGLIPALIVWRTGGPHWHGAGIAAGALCAGIGLTLMIATISLFAKEGDGTLAPWDKTRKLVVAGPYRHVRNPMISGVFFNLVAEALILGAPWIFLWFGFFVLLNTIFIPLWEEKDLEKRFGQPYRTYRANVPRWMPRLTPWQG